MHHNFIRQVAPNMALPETNLITIEAYNDLCISGKKHVMIDVRNSIQYDMLSFKWYMLAEKEMQLERQETNKFEKQSILENQTMIKGCVKVCHCPLSELKKTLENNEGIRVLQDKFQISIGEVYSSEQASFIHYGNEPLYVICRRGIDSVFATQLLIKNGFNAINIIGGLTAWHDMVDNKFPMY
jgi:rhodanese-related sulfurtransferase